MEDIKIFDPSFNSRTVGIAIMNHSKFRDLAMQASRRLRFDDSFMPCFIPVKLSAASPGSDRGFERFF
jgi:hypothetical protein